MYFVTIKREGYTLFCMSPSERFAIGLTEQQIVRLFVKDAAGAWQPLREWNAGQFSHTAFMSALQRREEPADAAELLKTLPPALQ